MINLPIFNLNLSEETEIDEQFFGILRYNLLQLLKNVIKYNLTGLFFELSYFCHCCSVEFDGGKGEVHLVLHFHAVFQQKFLEDADYGLFSVVFWDQLRSKLH